MHGLLDPDAAPGESLFDHHVYVICSDGDLEEGVSGEASSIAGTQELGNITMIYDRNRISIEGDTDVAFTEDVAKRYEAYGWHVQTVDWTNGGTEYVEDVPALHAAITAAGEVTDQPSLIVLDTIIAWPAPHAQGTEKAHGSALGDEEVAATKKVLGWDPDKTFEVPAEVIEHTRALRERGAEWGRAWDEQYAAWSDANPERAALLHRLKAKEMPAGLADALPTLRGRRQGRRDPRRLRQGHQRDRRRGARAAGAARPTWPAPTTPRSSPRPPSSRRAARPSEWTGDPYQGRVLHFGIREHGMGAIMNGIAADGLTRVFGGTFLTFSDYMRGSVRVAALSQLPVTYVWTHDSIGLGEDGPTHQPIEHLAALRAMPGLDVVRPADANETAACWQTVLSHSDRPAALVLTRQNVPVFPRGVDGFAGTDDVHRGGYVLLDADDATPDVVLMGTGSEVQLAVEARELLAADGIKARVVSLPCLEWFEQQDAAYRDTVLPPIVKARVAVEAGVKQGWREYVGDQGRIVSIERYGASADYARIYQEFGITATAVADAARDTIREGNNA